MKRIDADKADEKSEFVRIGVLIAIDNLDAVGEMIFRNADIPVCGSQARMPVVRKPLIEFANSTKVIRKR